MMFDRLCHARRKLGRVALVCSLGALGACTTLGPDYQQPQVSWLDSWNPDLYGQTAAPASQPQGDPGFWWQLFGDATLNHLIDTAYQQNLSLRVAGLRVLESRAQLGIADSTRFPQLQQLGGGANFVDRWDVNSGGLDNNQDFVSYNTGFNLAWELDFWGRFKRAIESADAAFFASIANQQNVQVLLSARIASLYYAYRTTELRIGIAHQNAGIQARSYEITRKLYQSGERSELDLQQARTQYLSTLSTIPDLQISLVKTRNALCSLLARPPGELPELAQPAVALPAIEPVMVADIPARLMMRRPDVRAAAWNVAVQSAQIGIAEADFYPSVSLLGSLGLSGTTLGNNSSDSLALSLGPAFSWNIFDHGRIANNVRLQDARLQQLIESYQDTVLAAAREIDDAAISVVKTAERQEILADSVRSGRRALDLANTRYREGYADFQRVLDAQQALFAQTERELINHGNHVSAVVALYKALGGGWTNTPIDELLPDSVRDTMKERSDWGSLLDAPLPAEPDSAPNQSGNIKYE